MKVPTLEVGNVKEEVRQANIVSPAAFGANKAKAIGQIGEGLAAVGKDVAMVVQRNAEADANNTTAQLNKQLNDAQNEVTQQFQGENIGQRNDAFNQKANDIINQSLNGKNGMSLRLSKAAAAQVLSRYQQSLSDVNTRDQSAYNDQSYKNAQAVNADNFINAKDDEQAMAARVASENATIEYNYGKGIRADVTSVAIKQNNSKLYISRASQLAYNSGDASVGLKYLNDNKANIEPDDFRTAFSALSDKNVSETNKAAGIATYTKNVANNYTDEQIAVAGSQIENPVIRNAYFGQFNKDKEARQKVSAASVAYITANPGIVTGAMSYPERALSIAFKDNQSSSNDSLSISGGDSFCSEIYTRFANALKNVSDPTTAMQMLTGALPEMNKEEGVSAMNLVSQKLSNGDLSEQYNVVDRNTTIQSIFKNITKTDKYIPSDPNVQQFQRMIPQLALEQAKMNGRGSNPSDSDSSKAATIAALKIAKLSTTGWLGTGSPVYDMDKIVKAANDYGYNMPQNPTAADLHGFLATLDPKEASEPQNVAYLHNKDTTNLRVAITNFFRDYH